MYLSNCLNVKSKVVSTNKLLHDPDSDGGMELGTWTFGAYIDFFVKATGIEFYKGDKYRKECENYIHRYTFSDEEKKKIVKALKGRLRGRNLYLKGAKMYYRLLPKNKREEHPLTIEKKWVYRLIELFSSDEPVIYYS